MTGAVALPSLSLRSRTQALFAPLWDDEAQSFLVLTLTVIALGVRLYVNLKLHPPGEYIRSDMWVYQMRAEHLFMRPGNVWDTFTPVGYPAFLAFLFRLAGGKNFVWVGVVQAFLGAAMVPLTHQLGKLTTRATVVASTSAMLVAFYPPFIFYSALVMSETLFGFLVTLAAYALIRSVERSQWRWLALAGFALSTGSAVRSNLAMVFPLLPLFAWIALGRDWRATWSWTLKLAAMTFPVLALVSIHMSRLAGHFVPFSTNGGLNFFLAHAEYIGVHYRQPPMVHEIVPIPNLLRYKPYFESLVPLYDEKFFYHQGLEVFKNDPYHLLIALDNVKEGLGLGIQDYWPQWPKQERLLSVWCHGFFFFVIVPTALHSVAMLWLRRFFQREEAGRLLLHLLLLSMVLTLYGFLGDPRVREPFDVFYMILGFDGIRRAQALVSRLRRERLVMPSDAKKPSDLIDNLTLPGQESPSPGA